MDTDPPWRCQLTALVWWRPVPGWPPRLAVGALVHYSRTPVGPYREVLAALVTPGLGRPAVTVPFLGVDSPASRDAGRANWSLPKRSAAFRGHPASGAVVAESDAWAVGARPGAAGPPLPALLLARLQQEAPDGRQVTAPLSARGTARPTRVAVDVGRGPGMPEWLPGGRCWGASVRGVLVLGAPERG